MSAKARAAAEALKAAIDRHLEACTARTGENDPIVQGAYERLRDAAQIYDDALFESYDEVTPFVLAEPSGHREVEVAFGEEPETLTLLLRRDYDVVDLDALLAAGSEAKVAGNGSEPEDDDEDEHAATAVFDLFRAYGVDGLAARAEEFGLEPVGGTLWVVDEIEGELDTDPFDGVDDEHVRLRVDEVYTY